MIPGYTRLRLSEEGIKASLFENPLSVRGEFVRDALVPPSLGEGSIPLIEVRLIHNAGAAGETYGSRRFFHKSFWQTE